MNRTDRLYAIVEELRAAGPRGRTSARLADVFEVTQRTVKRDVSALQQAGVPIWATGGPGGGYVLDAAATLPPISFTAAEASALALALAVAPDLPFAADGRAALAKVLAAMPDAARAEAHDLASRTWVRTTPALPLPPAAARTLDEGLRQRRVTVLDYTDAAGASSRSRPVEPMAYALNRGRWYLLAWCRLRDGGRWFRLDRVQAARLTADRFPLRDLRTTFGDPPPHAAPALPPG